MVLAGRPIKKLIILINTNKVALCYCKKGQLHCYPILSWLVAYLIKLINKEILQSVYNKTNVILFCSINCLFQI